MPESELPTWWRSFWGVVTLASLVPLAATDAYAALVPMLVAYGVACFGMEYLAEHSPPPPA